MLTEEMSRKIMQWLDQEMASVSVKNTISQHIDVILDSKISRSETIPTSINSFMALIELLRKTEFPVQPMLIIPLVSENTTISQRIPKGIAAITEELSDFEFPSLYLLDWESNKAMSAQEVYCAPLQVKLTAGEPNIYEYYEEVRFRKDIEENSEFIRDIRLEYFPRGVFR